ncbi:MAG: hypothetical protein J6Z14_12635 [Prevotella sp.]|nr:hypothetical protein [Prevotella sp.]
MRKTMMMLTALAAICLVVSGTILTSCDKIDDLEGMNDNRSFYSYRAYSNDFDY